MSISSAIAVGAQEEQLVTMRIQNQFLGIPVHKTREILKGQKITRIPLVSQEIAGTLNLRGRIVTVIDIRHRLQLTARADDANYMFVVVEHQGELYSLIVDSVGDVLTIPTADIQTPPPNLSANWRGVSSGIYKLQQELLVILDPGALFNFG